VLTKVHDEKKVSPESYFTLTASWFDEVEPSSPEKYLFPAQKVFCTLLAFHFIVFNLPCAAL